MCKRIAGFFLFVIAVVCVAWCASAAGAQQVVVSNLYENLDANRGLADAPVTFSRIGGEGDFTEGITPLIDGKKLPAQVNVLRKNKDGSVRHALVSFQVPTLAPGGKLKIDWLNEKPTAPPAFKEVVFFGKGKPELKLVLTPEQGKPLTSDLTLHLGANWRRKPVKVLHDGPVMREIEIHDIPVDADGNKDPHIEVYWRLRFFTGRKSFRVAAVVERCKPRIRGRHPMQYKFKSVKLVSAGKVLYEEGPYDHIDQMRYRIVVWTDGQLENIHRRPNYEYWWKNGFVPKYRWVTKKTPAQVDKFYGRRDEMRRHNRRKQGILEHGIILRHMPNTGGRWDLGPYPSWTQAYLLSGAPKTYRWILHADGNGGGAFFVHVREKGAPGYNIFTAKPRQHDKNQRLSLYRLPDGSRTPTQADHAHMPSIGYISYLLTGDTFYAEELSFWASYHAGEWPYKGLKWQGMDRSFHYSLRQVTDAAFILPDTHPLLPYYTKLLDKCFAEMNKGFVQSGWRVHSPLGGPFQCSGRQNWVNAMRCSVWMYAWVVWGLDNAVKKGFAAAKPVRDWAAEYIVGLYTSDDEFKAPDGKTYKIDPRDAMPYSTAIALLDTKVVDIKIPVTDKRGKPVLDDKGKPTFKMGKGVKVVNWKPKHIDNYAAVWYYTKLNIDNGWYPSRGLDQLPDAKGVWPLRPPGKGFGGGKMYWVWARRVTPHFNYHLQALTALSTAIDAEIPKAKEAWKLALQFGAKRGKYGIQIVPRRPDFAE